MRRIKRHTIRSLIKEELNRRVVIQENVDAIMKVVKDAAKSASPDEVKAMAQHLATKGMETFKEKLIDGGNLGDFIEKNGFPKIRDLLKSKAEELGGAEEDDSDEGDEEESEHEKQYGKPRAGSKKEAAGKLAALVKTVETWDRDEPVKTPGKNFLKSFVKAFKGAKDDEVDRMVQKLKDRSGWEEASKLAYAKPLLDTLGLS